MDALQLALERLVLGANAQYELHQEPRADWLVDELRKIYAAYPTRVGQVSVRQLADDRVEVVGKSGNARVLELADGIWTLANTAPAATASTPGAISTILADP